MKNVQDARGRTALHIAAERIKAEPKSLNVLLKKGIDYKLPDVVGRTALDIFLENADHGLECNFWESVCETIKYLLATVTENELKLAESTTGELHEYYV